MSKYLQDLKRIYTVAFISNDDQDLPELHLPLLSWRGRWPEAKSFPPVFPFFSRRSGSKVVIAKVLLCAIWNAASSTLFQGPRSLSWRPGWICLNNYLSGGYNFSTTKPHLISVSWSYRQGCCRSLNWLWQSQAAGSGWGQRHGRAIPCSCRGHRQTPACASYPSGGWTSHGKYPGTVLLLIVSSGFQTWLSQRLHW